MGSARDHTRDIWLSTWIRHAIRDTDSVYISFLLTVAHRYAMHFSHVQPHYSPLPLTSSQQFSPRSCLCVYVSVPLGLIGTAFLSMNRSLLTRFQEIISDYTTEESETSSPAGIKGQYFPVEEWVLTSPSLF